MSTEASGHPGCEQMQDMAESITVLVDSSDDELHEMTARWLAWTAPTAELSELVIRADEDTIPSPCRHARTTMATHLCARAEDGSQDSVARIEALSGAQLLDPAQARTSALDLVGTSTKQLARAAADVIAVNPPCPGDGDRLTSLIATHRDRVVQDSLERARRSLLSDSLGDALTNAVELVGAQDRFGELNPTICLPDARWDAAFCASVDEARALTSATPRSRVHALAVFGDLLGELAISAHWQQSPKQNNEDKAAKLLSGTSDKENIGYLCISQALVQDLPWLSSLAALHNLRTGHATPRGSTTPRTINESDAATALGLAGQVVEGWVETTYTAAGQQPPSPSTPQPSR